MVQRELLNRMKQYQTPDTMLKLPPNNWIVGAVCVMRVKETGEFLLVIETESKPYFLKEPKDRSPLAGGRGVDEPIITTLKREVEEESGIKRDEYEVDPVPIGFYNFKHSDDNPQLREKFPEEEYPNGPYIVAFEAWISEKQLQNRKFTSLRKEIRGHFVLQLNDDRLQRMTLRGGMEQILKASLRGDRYQVATVEPRRYSVKS